MKKICLLAIGSFFTVLAFSQNAVQTVPGQPKPGRGTTTQVAQPAQTAQTPSLTTASGTGKNGKAVQPATSNLPAYKRTAKTTEIKANSKAVKASN